MRLSLHTKRRRFLIATGVDAEPPERETPPVYLQMTDGDLTIVPDEEVYVEETEAMPFGFNV
jgi:hypothetical protein